MLEWRTEVRKHGHFFVFSFALIILVLFLHSWLDNSLSSIIWIFSVILISSASAAYVAIHVFNFLVRDFDLLFHMATFGTLKRYVLKATPLFLGMLLIGGVTLTGYLVMPDQEVTGSASAYMHIYSAKIFSVAAFVALTWLCARIVQPIRSLSMQMLTYGVVFGGFIAAQIYAYWTVFSLDNDSWSVGSTTDFLGLPMYVNILPIILGDAPNWDVTDAMKCALIVNICTIIVCFTFEFLTSRRTRGIKSTLLLNPA